MSNTEETPESSLKRNSLVDDFLESGRKKVKTSLSTDDKHIKDLEYMLKSVKALIKIVDEIWNNCKEHLTSRESIHSPFTFEREVFEEAKVEKKVRHLAIKTQKVSDTKDFGSLPDVPEDLSKLVYVDPPEESDILPDYNKYLEKSSILCKDVLLPFLTGFKEHLENVQVFLGQIEAWLIEPEEFESFLIKTFDGPGCLRCESKIDPSITFLYRSFCLDVDSKMDRTFDISTEKGREGLKATLDYIKTFEPVTQIEVKDAGEDAVNGAYTINGVSDGVYSYKRPGVWDGKPVIFHLYRDKNTAKWWICCKYEDQTDSPVFNYFYRTKATGEKYELPPMNGWDIHTVENGGVDPPPQILYKVDE